MELRVGSDTGVNYSFPAPNLFLGNAASGVNAVGDYTSFTFEPDSGNVTVSFAEYQVPTSVPVGAGPESITNGPGGKLWFPEPGANKIGSITHNGAFAEFPIPTGSNSLQDIAVGSDHNLWVTDYFGQTIWNVTPAGTAIPFVSGGYPTGIAADTQGNLWFLERFGNAVVRITPAGMITEFSIPTSNSQPFEITVGPDGNMWFTEGFGNKIGRITPAGEFTEFPIPSANSGPYGITKGSDGNMWFAETFFGNNVVNNIGRITMAGDITEFPVPTVGSLTIGITSGPDGSIWFTERQGNKIGRITTAGAITEFPVPTADSQPYAITMGTDMNLWFTEIGPSNIGKVVVQKAVSVSPATLGFGSQGLGSPTAAKTATIHNNLNTVVTFTSISITGANPGDFTQTGTTCGATLAANVSCTVSIQFAPTATGARTASLTIVDDASNSPQSVTLNGTGQQPVSVAPATLGFGTQGLGSPTAAKTTTINNNLSTAITFSSISITGTNPGDFVQTSTTCGAILAAQASCTVSVQFAPTATGSRTASLTIVDDASNSPQSVTLNGTGLQPVTVAPATLGFGSQGLGSPTAAKTATISNNLSTAVTFSSISITGANPADFVQTGTTCGAILAAQASCTVSIQFAPTATGARTASLAIADNASNSPQSVTLNGTGVQPVSVAPATLGFGSQGLGSPTAAKTATINNNLSTAVTFSSISITGTNPGDFVQTATTCGATLAAQTSCTVSIQFAPTALGARTASLTIVDDASNSPQSVTLNGTGVQPVSVTPATLGFGSQTVGSPTTAKTATIKNNLSTAVAFTSITITGANPGDFAQTATTCGATLAAQTSCTVSIQFAPTALGARTASLSIIDDAGNSPQSVTLNGTGK